MQFFLTEVVARLVAAYFLFDTYRTLRRGLSHGSFVPFEPDVVNWILESFQDRAALTVHRKRTPIRFWISIGLDALLLVACFYIVVFGWRQVSG
ncbi:hypothetical protein RPMA_16960 [Tardiphaga alba]|uniref:YggT family protein n=1 Tax=Tardiphaga alba TaxID=340268 RepID=A0ABX8AA35_9BRAD|nr:hypothetical protein [Tardiphaga alba]QUS40337.1 hypothetical protein RPMA_16960 [Tardiphaga alba]